MELNDKEEESLNFKYTKYKRKKKNYKKRKIIFYTKNIKNKGFKPNNRFRKFLFFLFFILLFIYIIYFILFHNKKQKEILNSKFIFKKINSTNTSIEQKELIKNKTANYYCCFFSLAKKENRYARELISYYMKLGVEKFVLVDNNLPNTEKLADVLPDYINNGTVEIIEMFGSSDGQAEIFENLYEKYKNKCEWISFFDFDEYLDIHFNDGKNLSLKEFLSDSKFDNCEAIGFNWLMYSDNGLIYYDNRTSIERFTTPDYYNHYNRFVKPIVRGNLSKIIFQPKQTNHLPTKDLKICNSLGKKPIYSPDCITPPVYKYAYLKHFSTRTAEEYINKIYRGRCRNIAYNVNERIEIFFKHNKLTEEKLKYFEKRLNRTFPRFHKRLISLQK